MSLNSVDILLVYFRKNTSLKNLLFLLIFQVLLINVSEKLKRKFKKNFKLYFYFKISFLENFTKKLVKKYSLFFLYKEEWYNKLKPMQLKYPFVGFFISVLFYK